MFKEYFIERNGERYRISVTADRHFPILRVQIDHKIPTQPIPFRWFWWPVGSSGARSEWISETETIEAQVDRMIETIFAEANQEEKEQTELEKYFSKTP